MLLIGIEQVVPRTLFGGMAAPLHIWISPAHYDPVMTPKTFGEMNGLVSFGLLLQRTSQYRKVKGKHRELGFHPSSISRSPVEPWAPCLPQLGCGKPLLLSSMSLETHCNGNYRRR